MRGGKGTGRPSDGAGPAARPTGFRPAAVSRQDAATGPEAPPFRRTAAGVALGRAPVPGGRL